MKIMEGYLKDISTHDDKTKKNAKLLIGVTIFWLILNGLALFPVTLDRIFSLRYFYLFGMVFYMCLTVGRLLYVIFDGDYEKIILLTFSANLCGFIGRLILEYGESTFMRDLTLTNVIVYLLAVPLFIEAGAYIENNKRG